MFPRRQNTTILKFLFFSAFLFVVTSLSSNSKLVHFEHDSDQNLFSGLISTTDLSSYQISPLHHGNEIPESPTDGTEQSQTEKETEKDDNTDDYDDIFNHILSHGTSISPCLKIHSSSQNTGYYFSLPLYILFHSWKSFLV